MKTLLTIAALTVLLSIAPRAMAAEEEYEKIRPETHDNVQSVEITVND